MKQIIDNIIYKTIINLNEARKLDNLRASFLGTLLHSISRVLELHLLEKSYVNHVALGELYESLVDNIDELVEIDLGQNGYVNGYVDENNELWSTDPLTYLNNLVGFININKNKIYNEVDNSSIFTKLDDIIKIIDMTIYKIKNLE